MYLDDRTIRLQLWDTAGQERFRTLIPSYIRDSAVTIIVFDVTCRQSFEAVDRWVNDVQRERGDDVLIVLVGNKADLGEAREVSPGEGEAKARSLNAAIFLETSAKTGAGVKTLFVEIAQALAKRDPAAGYEASAKANLIDVKLQPSPQDDYATRKSNCSC
jgi:Ras-related protein Rab-6A